MKSPEQPGPQELPAEEAVKTEERKITTPEQWAEITQQQRMALGLKEVYNLSPEQRKEWANERTAYIKNHIEYARSHNIPLINIFEKSLSWRFFSFCTQRKKFIWKI